MCIDFMRRCWFGSHGPNEKENGWSQSSSSYTKVQPTPSTSGSDQRASAPSSKGSSVASAASLAGILKRAKAGHMAKKRLNFDAFDALEIENEETEETEGNCTCH